MKAGSGTRITLHFELAISGGEVVDSNFDGEPACFTWADGSLPEHLEVLLTGMSAGQEKSWHLPAERGFGEVLASRVQNVPLERFSERPEHNSVILFEQSGTTGLPGVIRSVGLTHAEVDFNHPLAGHDLDFRVKIVKVEPLKKP